MEGFRPCFDPRPREGGDGSILIALPLIKVFRSTPP